MPRHIDRRQRHQLCYFGGKACINLRYFISDLVVVLMVFHREEHGGHFLSKKRALITAIEPVGVFVRPQFQADCFIGRAQRCGHWCTGFTAIDVDLSRRTAANHVHVEDSANLRQWNRGRLCIGLGTQESCLFTIEGNEDHRACGTLTCSAACLHGARHGQHACNAGRVVIGAVIDLVVTTATRAHVVVMRADDDVARTCARDGASIGDRTGKHRHQVWAGLRILVDRLPK